MESRYLALERAVLHRRIWLNTLAGWRACVTVAMSATLIYLMAVYLGFLGMLPWWLLAVGNVLALWIGTRRGRRQPVTVQHDLYRVDREFGLCERLSTIHELRRSSGNTDFLMALYGRLADLPERVENALPLSERERRGWLLLGSLAVTSLFLLGLWFSGVPPLQLSQLWSSTSSEDTSMTASWPDAPSSPNEVTPLEELSLRTTKDAADTDLLSHTPGRANPTSQPGTPCTEPDGATRLAEDQVSATTCAQVSPEEELTPQNAIPLVGSLEEARALRQALAELQERLERGELSLDQVTEELERLAEQMSTPQAEEALQRAAQADDLSEMSRRIDETLSRLQRQLAENTGNASSIDAEEELSERPQGRASQHPGDSAQDEDTPATADSSAGEGTSQEQAEGSDPHAASNAPSDPNSTAEASGTATGSQSSSPDSEASAQEGVASSEAGDGGDAAGQQPGSASPSTSETQISAAPRDLLIHNGNLPRDPQLLERLLTQGIPVDLANSQPAGAPILRLNLERVEALLQLRNLPPELRELVRAYFLAITRDR
jgi:exonuclease VII small subunit